MDNALPEEISVNPVPHISLLGLDTGGDQIHASVWNSFAINRIGPERPALYYTLISLEHRFPPAKNRKSLDRYIPKGIIKRLWLYKHLYQIPSLVVVFEHISWSKLIHDKDARGRLVNRMICLKNDLSERQIKTALILLQPDPIQFNDDPSYADQATKLCEECDISPKSLFIIQINDPSCILGYVQRIEVALNELAKNHYAVKAKTIKSNKDQLNKSLQNYLFVRYEFKMGFYHEIRQIYSQALTHYKNAYTNLMEIRITTMNISEVKNVAAMLNHKIVRLCFHLNTPLDAISYFKKHVEIFQNKFVAEQIKFEHYAWLSRQFYMFAELFDQSINMYNLTPSTSQNPGYYFFEAAMYTVKRRNAARAYRHLKDGLTDAERRLISEILAQRDRVEYVGQLPWYKNDSFSEYVDNEIGFKALQYAEQLLDHTPYLINLYINDLNQIKKFKRPRHMRHVMFLIGEENYKIQNYGEALNYFCNILPFYREEKWRSLHMKIARLAFCSAYFAVDFNNFIKCGFELIANQSLVEQDVTDIVHCLISHLNFQYKWLPSQFTEDECSQQPQHPDQAWNQKLLDLSRNETLNEIVINADHEINFIKCKVFFSRQKYSMEEPIDISVVIFSELPVDLNDMDVQLKFDNPKLDENCSLIATDPNSIQLKATSLNHFEFRLKPLCESIENFQKIIKIVEVSFVIKTRIPVKFQWTLTQNRPVVLVKEFNDDAVRFNKIDLRTSVDIEEHKSQLEMEIKHNEVLFDNENCLITVQITSGEKHPVSNILATLKVMAGNGDTDSRCEWFAIQNGGLAKIEDRGFLIADRLDPGQTNATQILLRALGTGSKTITVQSSYDLLMKCGQKSRKFLITKICSSPIKVIEPFLFSSMISNYANPETANIRVDEPFRLTISLKTQNPGLEICQTGAQFTDHLTILSKNCDQTPTMVLSTEKTFDESYLMICHKESSLHSLGYWSVRWVRQQTDPNQKGFIVSETIIPLPSVMVSPALVYVELVLPEKTYARNPFMAKYKIYSRLEMDVTIEIGMGNAEYFMIAGNRQIKLNLPSRNDTVQTFIFFPLICGTLVLPRIDISVQAVGAPNSVKVDYINQMIASTIFVLPKLRTAVDI